MKSLPPTIRHPNTFQESQTPGFDGVFDWRWVTRGIKRINPDSKITPMDVDGWVERRRQFLIFETKHLGVTVPGGQKGALRVIASERNKTVWVIWGKQYPERMTWWVSENPAQDVVLNPAQCSAYVAAWYRFADRGRTPSVKELLEEAEAFMDEGDPFDESDPLDTDEEENSREWLDDPFAQHVGDFPYWKELRR